MSGSLLLFVVGLFLGLGLGHMAGSADGRARVLRCPRCGEVLVPHELNAGGETRMEWLCPRCRQAFDEPDEEG